ncbi:hypothetical protein [Shinella kummerowiae]|nr:hypothetical protein [Shinella kummerowiae]
MTRDFVRSSATVCCLLWDYAAAVVIAGLPQRHVFPYMGQVKRE